MMDACYPQLIGLVLLSLALLISVCLNVIFFIRHRASLLRDKRDSAHIFEEEGLTQADAHYFHDLNHHEEQENPHNYHDQQENPIYGNITIDRRETYETMTKQQTNNRLKPPETDLNYASLDLKVANKRKKHRHQFGPTQGRNNVQDQLPVHQHDFLDVEADMDAQLPSRDTSTMVSHSSIYLNSQQIVQEAEDMERERGTNAECENAGWDGVRRREDVGSRKWKGEQESEERRDRDDDDDHSARTQLSEVHDAQSGTEAFNGGFNGDGE